MDSDESFPHLAAVVLDCADARLLAEFYRQLLGLSYRAGDEPPEEGNPDERGRDWLVLTDPGGSARIAFQQVDAHRQSTWPDNAVPQQLHLDMTVPSIEQLEIQHRRATELGARLLQDRSHDEEEPLRVYADPAGHPFCIFFAPS
jgi:catechol-2,3-dioxygenase